MKKNLADVRTEFLRARVRTGLSPEAALNYISITQGVLFGTGTIDDVDFFASSENIASLVALVMAHSRRESSKR